MNVHSEKEKSHCTLKEKAVGYCSLGVSSGMQYPWLHTHRIWVAGFMPSAVHKHVPAPAACLPCLSGSKRCQRQPGTAQGNTLGARAEPRAEGWEVPVGWDSDNTENTMVIHLTGSVILFVSHIKLSLYY